MHRDLCDFLLEIAANSLEAGAQELKICWNQGLGRLVCEVTDNGKGMTIDELARLEDPWFSEAGKHSKRKAGLGIPFLVQTLQMTDGEFKVDSEKGIGTRVYCSFNLDHIDTPPVGNMVEAFASLMSMPGEHEIVLERRMIQPSGSYHVRRSELLEVLGELDTAESQMLLREYLESCEQSLFADQGEG